MKKIILFASILFLCNKVQSQNSSFQNDTISYYSNQLKLIEKIGVTTIMWDIKLNNNDFYVYKNYYERGKKDKLVLTKTIISIFNKSILNRIEKTNSSENNEFIFYLNKNQYPFCFENTDERDIEIMLKKEKKYARNDLMSDCENPIRIKYQNNNLEIVNTFINYLLNQR
jgi:predicted transcriptional regulator